MPCRAKSADTDRQKRQATHIEDSALERGRSRKTPSAIAWTAVDKQDGGGQQSGRGRRGTDKQAA